MRTTMLGTAVMLALIATPVLAQSGGGIIYYGNGAVVTNPPADDSAPPPPPMPSNNGVRTVAPTYSTCAPAVFPNPPAPCNNPGYDDATNGDVDPNGYNYWGAPVVILPPRGDVPRYVAPPVVHTPTTEVTVRHNPLQYHRPPTSAAVPGVTTPAAPSSQPSRTTPSNP